jgi:hypothetical protein
LTTDGVVVATRVLGALSLLAVGAIHLQQYGERYSAIPAIGTLFVLSFVGATAVSVGLLAPVERVAGRWGGPAVVVLALLGAGQAATQFVFLTISERRPLFGFQEPGYDPTAILASRVAEVATVVFLTTFLVAWTVRWRGGVATAASASQQIENRTAGPLR